MQNEEKNPFPDIDKLSDPGKTQAVSPENSTELFSDQQNQFIDPASKEAEPPSQGNASQNSTDLIDPAGKNKSSEKRRLSIYRVALPITAIVALATSGGYFYWRVYESSQEKIAEATMLYSEACQSVSLDHLNTINLAQQKINQATSLLQGIPRLPGLEHEILDQSLARLSQCDQQIQTAESNFIYRLESTQIIQELIYEFVSFSNSLSSRMGYQRYSEELAYLDNKLQEFQQTNLYLDLQNQDRFSALNNALKSLNSAHTDFMFAETVWSYCDVQNACFRTFRTKEAYLPTSDPLPEVSILLINNYRLTSTIALGGQGIALNTALDQVWNDARQSLSQAQQIAENELQMLQGSTL